MTEPTQQAEPVKLNTPPRVICGHCHTAEPEGSRFTFFQLAASDPQADRRLFMPLCDPCLQREVDRVSGRAIPVQEIQKAIGPAPEPLPDLGPDPVKVEPKDLSTAELRELRARIQNLGFEINYAILRATDALGESLRALGNADNVSIG